MNDSTRTIGQWLLNALKVIGLFALNMLATILLGVFMPLTAIFGLWGGLILFILALIVQIGVAILAWRLYQRWQSGDNLAKLGRKDFLYGVGFWLVVRLLIVILNYFMVHFEGIETTPNDASLQLMLNSTKNIWGALIFALMTTVGAPIIEEIVFRAGFKHLLFKPGQFYAPLLVSSTIFAFFHGPTGIFSFLMYFLLGVALYLAYSRRNNIMDSMLLHFLNNGVSVAFLILTHLLNLS